MVDHAGAHRVDDPFVPSRAEIDLGPASGRPRVRARTTGHGARAVARALRRAVKTRAISRSDALATGGSIAAPARPCARLRGARRSELAYVVESVERLALARQLTPSRMPALFLQLRRNTAYWASKPVPGERVTKSRSAAASCCTSISPAAACSFIPCRTSRRPTSYQRLWKPGGGKARLRRGTPRAHGRHPLPSQTAAPPPRRAVRPGSPARPRVHRLGVPVRVRRRLAPVDERHGPGDGAHRPCPGRAALEDAEYDTIAEEALGAFRSIPRLG